ncbi:MAG TPA: hypothetical protein VMF50_11715 [Candidatus Binataceae bacterium]|nr:hypothetical protein [Candidatus Binataceae bacterium]
MRLNLIAASVAIALAIPLFAAKAHAARCDCECTNEYRSDINFCQTVAGIDRLDNDRSCFQNARDDYRTCVDDCSDPLGLTLK